jgi:O-methyltransferase
MAGSRVPAVELRDRYLDLLERTLTHTAYADLDIGRPGRNPITRRLVRMLERLGVVCLRLTPQDGATRERGEDWPVFAHTMAGVQRLRNTRWCVEQALTEGVAGDLIEAGTWRGGSAMMMRGVLDAYGDTERALYVADTFAGLPAPQPERYPADRGARWHREPRLSVSVAEVRANFERLGLLDDRVNFLEGPFADTLPAMAERTWAVVRLDGDMYESTIVALRHLWPGVAPGGFVIVDDYGAVGPCRQAVDDFRSEHGIDAELHSVDWTGAWWRR